MAALIFLGVTACILSFLLTPVISRLFLALDIVDHPDGSRKLHGRPVPRAGGLPIALSFGGAIGIAMIVLPEGSRLASHHTPIFGWLFAAAAIILITGLVDDAIGLRPWSKLAMQLIAAGLACWGGVRIDAIAGHPISLWWGAPLTLFWIVACTNALNLIDGLDGLATGVGLFATVTALTAACLQDNIGLALATAPLAGALLGFLRYNFNPASVFLGDSGSLTVGFLLGCFAVIWCQKSATLLGMAAPLISLLVPLTDVGVSVARRFLSDRPIFVADGRHIHHRLLARGFRPRTAALVLYIACGAAAVLSLLDCVLSQQIGGFVVVLVCCLAWAGIRFLRYDEFAVARRLAVTRRFRRAVNEELCLRKFETRIADARTLEECWPIICDLCHDIKFHSVSLLSPEQNFEESVLSSETSVSGAPSDWRLQIAIHSQISLVLHRTCDDGDILPGMGCLKIVQLALQAKLPGLSAASSGSSVAPELPQPAARPGLPQATAAFVSS
jgi:UDP-GlcNAc:undecaprenyl-phosphate GlcNAc-1-phosphate transferase